MDREKASKILGEMIQPDGSLNDLFTYISWNVGDKNVSIDSAFNAEELEAIAWWIRNTKQ